MMITREAPAGRVGVPGTLRCAPTRARTVAGDPDETVLPAPMAVEVGPTGRADVVLAATEPSWCWAVSWRSAAGSWDEWVAVPDSATPVDWTDLVRVDPATLAPTAAPEAAWWAVVEAIESQPQPVTTIDGMPPGVQGDVPLAGRYEPLAPGLIAIASPAPPAPLAHVGMYALYDALATAHPGYVAMTMLGVDAAGNQLREYRLCEPANLALYTTVVKPVIGLISGMHGIEKASAMALYRFAAALTNREGGEATRRLRAAIDIRIIPVVNPSGWDASTYTNGRGVNIDANFSAQWSVAGGISGSGPASEPETQIIQTWMAAARLRYLLDCHWNNQTASDQDVSYIGVSAGQALKEAPVRAFSAALHDLAGVWRSRWPDATFPADEGPVGKVVDSYYAAGKAHVYAATIGIAAAQVELRSPVRYVAQDSRSSIIGAEVIGNTVARLVEVEMMPPLTLRDTGWVNVSPVLAASWSADAVAGLQVRRVGDRVDLLVQLRPATAMIGTAVTGLRDIGIIPLGYRPYVAYNDEPLGSLVLVPNLAWFSVRCATSGRLSVATQWNATGNWLDTSRMAGRLSWITTDPYPTI